MQFERLSVPNLYLMLKYKIVLFEKYRYFSQFSCSIYQFKLIAKESFQMLKSTENVNSKGSGPCWKTKCVPAENLGQNIWDKFTKFSKISFSRDCFTADFWEFSSKMVKILFVAGPLGNFLQLLKFTNFLKS